MPEGFRWLWVSAAVVALDQLTKALASATLTLHKPVRLTPFLNLTLVHNPGAAFSFLAGASGWQRWFFAFLAIAIGLGILLWLARLKPHERFTAFALSLVLGGAAGNLIDRLLHGHVIDFIDVHAGGWHWPAFNVADSAITAGALLLVAETLWRR